MATGLEYSTLHAASKQCRLLHFSQPFQKDSSKPLQCALKTVCLTEDPTPIFSAISWCWADWSERASIVIDGNEVSLPKSAETALRYLHDQRSPLKSGSHDNNREVHCIWMDALCINQSDLAERSEQVSIMGEIYSKADQVLIWLGEDEGTSSRAIQSINLALSHCREQTNDLTDFDQELFRFDRGSLEFRLTDKPLPQGLDWRALRFFFSSPWFSRLWIMQEAALARQAFFYRGSHCIDVASVLTAAVWMQSREYWRYSHLLIFGITTSVEIYSIRRVLQKCRLKGNHQGACEPRHCSSWCNMSFLLSNAGSDRHCTDPKDRVYGLIGLFGPDVQGRIRVKYDDALVEIYARATRLAIETTGSFHLLAFAGNRGPLDDLRTKQGWPSWVPCFQRPPNVEENARPLRWGVYNASSKSSALREAIADSPLCLRVCILRADIVEKVSAPVPFRPFWSHQQVNHVLRRLWWDFRPLMEASEYAVALEEVFCLTLVTGIDHRNDRFTDEQVASMDFKGMLDNILYEDEELGNPLAFSEDGTHTGSEAGFSEDDSLTPAEAVTLSVANISLNGIGSDSGQSGRSDQSLYSPNHDDVPIDDVSVEEDDVWQGYDTSKGALGIVESFDLPATTDSSFPTMTLGTSDGWNFYQAFNLWCENRCFFVTKSGLLGLGPAGMQALDEVHIVYGSEIPFIIRVSTDDSGKEMCELVGECYVAGIMMGELVEQLGANRTREECSSWIVLN